MVQFVEIHIRGSLTLSSKLWNGHILDLTCINGDWDKSPGKCIKKPVCEVNSYAACILPQVCHDTCDNYLSQNKFECDNSLPCEWGCKCDEGFVLNSENKCVHPDQCGCPDPNFVANSDVTADDSGGPSGIWSSTYGDMSSQVPEAVDDLDGCANFWPSGVP